VLHLIVTSYSHTLCMLSYPNFIQGLSFVDLLILASRIAVLNTSYSVKQMIIQCFDQGCENTQRGGQKGHFKAFSRSNALNDFLCFSKFKTSFQGPTPSTNFCSQLKSIFHKKKHKNNVTHKLSDLKNYVGLSSSLHLRKRKSEGNTLVDPKK